LNLLTINGDLIFQDTRTNTLHAHYIWVRAGNLKAGDANTPFVNKINIILNGTKEDRHLLIDPFVDGGNKVLAVTGGL